NEFAKTVSPTRTPDEARWLGGRKALAMPVGLEALDDLANLSGVGRHHRVVASFGEVSRRPIERLHEGSLLIHHHRFFVRELKRGVSVYDLDPGAQQLLASLFVVLLATAAGRVQDHPDLHPTTPRRDHSLEQGRGGKNEHLDSQ